MKCTAATISSRWQHGLRRMHSLQLLLRPVAVIYPWKNPRYQCQIG